MNLERFSKYVGVVLVLLLVPSVVFALDFSQNQTELITEYTPTGYSNFSIVWNDSSGSVNASLEHNFTGILQNESMGGTYPNFYYNSNVLGVGSYQYRFLANNSTGNENSTSIEQFTINQATPSLYYEISDDYLSFQKGNNFTITVWASDLSLETNIYANFSDTLKLINTSSGNNTNITDTSNLEIGAYNISANITGNDNYTDVPTLSTWILFLTDLNWTEKTETPVSGVVYTPNENYNFSINWAGSISNVIFEANFLNGSQTYTNDTSTYNNITINRSGDVYWIEFSDLPAGNYYYKWKATDTNDITIEIEDNYIINKFSVTPSLGNSEASWTTTTSTAITLTCSIPQQVDIQITVGCTSNINKGTTSCPFSTPSVQGSTVFTCTILDANYTGYTTETLSYFPFDDGGGGGGGGESSSSAGTFGISASSSKTTIAAGFGGSITFTLTNTLGNDITGIEISVTGIEESWYSLDKTAIDRIRRNGATDKVKMTLNIPADAELNIYSIKFKATGKELGLDTITKSSTVVLTVSEAPEEEAVVGEPETVATSQTAETLGAEGEEESPTGFALSPDVLPDVILIIGILSSGVIFLFRDNVTKSFYMIGRKRGAVVDSLEEKYPEQPVVKKKSKTLTEIKTSWIDRLKQYYGKYNYSVAFNVQKKPDTKDDEENKNV